MTSTPAVVLKGNPNPDGWGVYESQNFEQVYLHIALSNEKF
jgi:hypothetical protein